MHFFENRQGCGMTDNNQEHIRALYKEGAREMPGSDLDNRILAQAQDKIADSIMPTPLAKPSRWRQWQWPVSVAASIALVSLLFLDNLTEFQPPDIEGDRALIPNQSLPTINAPEANEQKVSESLNSNTELTTESEGNIPAGKTVLSDVGDELAINRSRTKKVASPIGTLSNSKNEVLEAIAEDAYRPEEMEQIVVAGSRVSIRVLDEPYLTALLDEIKQLRLRLESKDLSAQQSRVAKKQLADLNQNIYDELHDFRTSNPQNPIPEKYLAVLNDMQRSELEELYSESSDDNKKQPND